MCRRYPLLLCFALLCAQLWIYAPLLGKSQLLRHDDQLLVEPLYQIHSIPELWQHWRSARAPDVQPIRDLSYLADIQIEKTLGHQSFHAQNILLWLAAVALAYQIIGQFFAPSLTLAALVFCWSLHPAFVMSIAWVAARKHLLALFFTLLATKFLLRLKTPQGRLKILFSYLAAIFSQPIALAWPAWAGLQLWPARKDKQNKILLLLLLASAAIVTWLNHAKYSQFYAAQAYAEKIAQLQLGSFRPLSASILAWGRLCLQLFAPFHFAAYYEQQNLLNVWGALLGLVFFLSCLLVAKKKRILRAYFSWLLFFHVPLFLVFTKIQDSFWFDTYLLIPGLAVLVPLAFLTEKIIPRAKQALLLVVLAALSFSFILQSRVLAQTWQSDLTLWEASFVEEPGCISSLTYSVELLRSHKFPEAVAISQHYFGHACTTGPTTAPFFYLMAYWNPALKQSQKLQIFADTKNNNPLRRLLLSLLRYRFESQTQALNDLGRLLDERPDFLGLLDDVERQPIEELLSHECKATSAFCRLLIEKYPAHP